MIEQIDAEMNRMKKTVVCLSIPKTALMRAYKRQSKINVTTLIMINLFVLMPKLNKELKIDI
ncbi:hypothetical protein GCM10022410_18050 [Amphibacillus indicireducens]|uniref:Uncharacterized protein n=1 Tax=Amphibacillus indicireducens TaxID=1076330 RepID=A0ABP7VRM9_9BACI